MRSASPLIAAGFALAVAGQAFAQANSPMSPGGAPPTGPTTSQPPAAAPSAEPSSPSTPTTPSTPSAQGSGAPASATAAGAAAAPATPPSYTVGESVKDNTGASIGTITGLSGSGANQMATIKMGDQSFQVQASRLGSADGAAEINMTKAQIAAMLKSSSAK
jgi:hypothetical protein